MRAVVVMFIQCLFLWSGSIKAQDSSFHFTSVYVNDTYDIIVTKISAGTGNIYSSVYYFDADIRSGKKLRQVIKESKIKKNIIFIGIANRGKTLHQFRKRDYIPPVIYKSDTIHSIRKNYGHADNFYKFLEKELIPFIETHYKLNNKRTIIGHSLGGLFAFYCLFKKERIFQNFISLSPSLWADHYNIFNYEKVFHNTNSTFNNLLFFNAGLRERLNLIIPGTRKMNRLLLKRNYPGLKVTYVEHKKKRHFNQLFIAFPYIFENIDL